MQLSLGVAPLWHSLAQFSCTFDRNWTNGWHNFNYVPTFERIYIMGTIRPNFHHFLRKVCHVRGEDKISHHFWVALVHLKEDHQIFKHFWREVHHLYRRRKYLYHLLKTMPHIEGRGLNLHPLSFFVSSWWWRILVFM